MPPAICRRKRPPPGLKHLGCPLFTFPFGQSRGLGEAQDVAVKDLIVNPVVFVKNELTISGQVRVDGYVNVPIPVRAAVRDGARARWRSSPSRRSRPRPTANSLPDQSELRPASARRTSAHARSGQPAGRVGHHQQPAEHVRQRAQGRAQRALPHRLAAAAER